MRAILPLLLVLFGCGVPAAPSLAPESDAGTVLEPEADLWVDSPAGRVQVTALPGPEDGAATSPDGRHLAFLSPSTGIASVWVAEIPAAGEPPRAPRQLTNVGLEKLAREPGQPPLGFVPTPDLGPLRWDGVRTIVWTAGGVEHRVEIDK